MNKPSRVDATREVFEVKIFFKNFENLFILKKTCELASPRFLSHIVLQMFPC